MDWSTNFEQSLRQLSEMQRRIFSSWSSTIPRTQNFNMPNFHDTFDNTLKFQEQVVTSSLELQALVARLSIEAQKQFWESYLNMLRKP
ncbi:MAG TPA: thylakoid-associated protein [Coleofasciculaceae cyanobacterium]